ncbi:tyrosine--tRNA ligase [Blattabacterium cuenoti]|uniref:tyrosine--tRNA ligase n=1 Tax=Blattabacterium cuenoti TaxID=1653831 RepID=UPI00163D3244|nr:tyrosine--tRNA ligase [Blattabacterium cuenoti]
MKNIIDELSWRGLIKTTVSGIEKQLQNPTTIYIGFDPTSDSLHLGNLLPVVLLIHFQKMGHKSLALIGGATSMIGDPSGKNEKRIISFNQKILHYNITSITKQLHNLFTFYLKDKNIEILNNLNWIKKLDILFFLRKIGKEISVNYLMAKESVKNRIENNQHDGISFMEFSYSLLQGYDFYYLNKKKNCLLQAGGSDQWGNIITGIDIIRKISKKKVYGLTFPLITNSSGKKFGKSEKGENIWLDHKRTTPYKFYQFFINLSDNEIEKFVKLYTFFSKEKINQLIINHRKCPENRLLQKTVAFTVTKWVHGKTISEELSAISTILFEKHNINSLLNEKMLYYIFKHIPNLLISYEKFKQGIFLTDLLKHFFTSKTNILRAIKNHSISINKQIIKNNIVIQQQHIIGLKYILLKFGKKKFFIIKIV